MGVKWQGKQRVHAVRGGSDDAQNKAFGFGVHGRRLVVGVISVKSVWRTPFSGIRFTVVVEVMIRSSYLVCRRDGKKIDRQDSRPIGRIFLSWPMISDIRPMSETKFELRSCVD